MKVYITFGQIHVHSVNGKTLDKDCVGVIKCESLGEGRQLAMTLFNGRFHQALTRKEVDDGDVMQYFPRGFINVN